MSKSSLHDEKWRAAFLRGEVGFLFSPPAPSIAMHVSDDETADLSKFKVERERALRAHEDLAQRFEELSAPFLRALASKKDENNAK